MISSDFRALHLVSYITLIRFLFVFRTLGRMATAGGKVTIIDAQKDPRINLDVDLDTDDDPLHCCTLQAISGQVMAIIQVRIVHIHRSSQKAMRECLPPCTS